jgi:capsular polysaccharide biosynthesis protein
MNDVKAEPIARSTAENRPVPPPLGAPAPPVPPAAAAPRGSITRFLARDWLRIGLITAGVALLAWGLAVMQPPRYRASALAAVAPLSEKLQPNEALRSVEVLERRTVVATIAALASTPSTRSRARATSAYEIQASVLPNTNLFRIDVEGANRAEAAAIANRLPALLSEQTQAMFRYYAVTMVSPATPPESPFLPRPGRAIAAGAMIGLFLGLLASYATLRRSARRGSAP